MVVAVNRKKLIDGFSKWLSQDKSEGTVTKYLNSVKRFLDYCPNPLNAKKMEIAAWRDSMDHLAPATIVVHLSAIRAFFEFLIVQGWVKADPTSYLKYPPIPDTLPVVLEEKEVEDILEIESDDDPWVILRDRVILETLYGSGLRRNEVACLRVGNLDPINQTIKLIGKRNKERIVPISGKQFEVLMDWLILRFGDAKTKKLMAELDKRAAFVELCKRKEIEDEAILITNSGKPLTEWKDPGQFIWQRVRKYAGKDVHPHLFRSSFATHLLEAGAEAKSLKDILGHKRYEMLDKYARTQSKGVRRVAKLHPRS